jgi:glutamate synthase (NADPH/NADH) large chain
LIDEVLLKGLVDSTHRLPGACRRGACSTTGNGIAPRFVKIMPHEYRRALTEMAAQKQLEAA